MAKFVPDIKTQRWIVISPTRFDRPDDHKADEKKEKVCPFCSGHEEMTPLEVYRVGGEGEWNKPGWKVRVVPNKFPITDIHEVIIHSPDHSKDIADFDVSQISNILSVYRNRYQTHLEDGQVMIFSNHGEHAGASLEHPHSQLVVIPKQINLDALVREPIQNVVDDNTFFVTYCPDFSQWPYEVWIAPKKEGTTFADITDKESKDLAQLLKQALNRLRTIYSIPSVKKLHGREQFVYNYYIHHAKSWFLRIIPRLIHRAGFELGTGLSVNIIDPTEAAKQLREIKL